MRCRRLPNWFTGVVLAAALTAISSSALAYFTGQGVGSASAAVSQLGAPTITTATPAVVGTVTLAWSSVSAPDSGAVMYYVTRDGGDPAGTCAVPAVPAAATSCIDKEVPVGSHSYAITAVWRSWTATSSASTVKVSTGAVTHFTIGAATSTPAVSAADNLTIAAKDDGENTVATYTGSHSLVFSGASASPGGTVPTVANSSGSAIAFGQATAINFSAGVATVSSSKNGLMKIYRAGPASVAATESSTSIGTASPLAIVVTPGAPSKYTLAAATTTPEAGATDDLTIAAFDTYGNTVTTHTGSHSLVFSGASAGPAGNLPTVSDSTGAEVPFGTATAIDFVAGVATASGPANGEMRLYKSGSTSVKVSEGALTNPTALVLTVAAGAAAKLVLTGSTATPVAAASSNLTTTAKDAYENTATAYAGLKDLTFSGAVPSPNGTAPSVVNTSGTVVPFGTATTLNFKAGAAAVASSKNGLMRLYTAGPTSISASDGTISTAAPLALTVAPGAATKLGLTTVAASAGVIGSPCLFTCPVTTLGNGGTIAANVSVTDSAGNPVSNLGGGHAVKVTATGGTVAGTPLTIEATGPAVSATRFTYTAPASGNFTNTITAAVSAGTSYTSAAATASR
jgi:hypothetical protein